MLHIEQLRKSDLTVRDLQILHNTIILSERCVTDGVERTPSSVCSQVSQLSTEHHTITPTRKTGAGGERQGHQQTSFRQETLCPQQTPPHTKPQQWREQNNE